MRTYRCICNNTIFFDNNQCLSCGDELGFCPVCRNLVGLLPGTPSDTPGQETYLCGNADCGASLVKCENYWEHHVCNRCIAAPPADAESAAPVGLLCDCCRFNFTVPDLSVEGNWLKWQRLEAAKRRLFYDLSELGLPYGTVEDGIEPSLRFDFKADVIPKGDLWRKVGKAEKVFTGHANGTITINIREADDVEREKLRVDMGEAQRTLIGHFRHEIGHFYWEVLVKGRREAECKAVFGDHEQPTYAEALDTYYKNGPPADWQENFISGYATMHPWEDFAETWATYLDMISALDTAQHMGFGGTSDPVNTDLDAMVARYQQLGIAMNEINRSIGLIDVVPEVFVPPVVEKLRFIHWLIHLGRGENQALAGENVEAANASGAAPTKQTQAQAQTG